MTTPETTPPFTVTYSSGIPELLHQLQCTILISTYQAGKVISLSPLSPEKLIQLPRTFSKPMGIALTPDQQKMAIATKDAVILLANSSELARHYPKKPGVYDAMYLPRVSYFTNALDIHDLEFVGDDLYAVNTLFSCIVKLSERYNFEQVWKPVFITDMQSDDRCHLNGMAVLDGRIAYATAFSTTNEASGWRKTIPHSGVLFDVRNNSILAGDLAMPHSPRIIEGRLLVLLSATGQIMEINTTNGEKTEIRKLPGFLRGMAYHNGYLFIGHSLLRENSSSFGKLDLTFQKSRAGVSIVHLASGAFIGEISYLQSVDEIYDVKVLAGVIRPNILNNLSDDYTLAISTPSRTYWARPEKSHDHDAQQT